MKDVIIVGGGMIGLSCAWHLQEAGLKVTIVDRGDFSDGCSYGNAGMIVPSHFVPLASPGMLSEGIRWMFKSKSPFFIRPRLNAELISWLWKFLRSANANHAASCASVLRDMHEESRAIFKTWSSLPGFSFDLQEKGILMLFNSAKAEKDEIETAEKANALGIKAVVLNENQLSQLEPNAKLNVRGAVHYPGDATFSPDVLMQQLKTVLQKNGADFISNFHVDKLADGKSSAFVVSKDGKKMEAKNVVVACGAWSGKLLTSIGYSLPMQGGKGYSMTLDNVQNKPSIPSLLHEARVSITPMGNRLRIGGTLEISGWDEKIREAKIKWILESIPNYYPDLHISRPEEIWYGYRPCTPDGMPVIGQYHPDSSITLATGHSMMGISLAPATGRMIRDLILARVSSITLVDPRRF